MNFTINKHTKTTFDNDYIIIKNLKTNSYIKISSEFKGLFDDIVNGKSLNNLITDFQKKYKIDFLNAQKQINTLIYSLLHQNLIEIISERKVGDINTNIKSALIEITDCCNFKCPHCYVDKTRSNILNFNQIKNLCLELQQFNCNRIALTGGEIFTNKDFTKIYNFLYDYGFIVSINTNLSLLDNSLINLFSQKPPYEIEVSLYGYDSKSFSYFTKSNNKFEDILFNLKQLKDLGLNITLKNIITKDNYEYFNKIEELAEKLHIKFKSDYITFPKICNKFESNSQQISPQEAINHLQLHNGAKEHFINLYSSPYNMNNFLFKCKTKDDTLFINSKLEISMCVCMQSKSLRYKKGQLKNIVTSLQTLKNIEFSENAKCKSCKYMPICRYCPGKFYMTTGDYENPPEWFCEFAKLIYKNFIQGRAIIRKHYLHNNELEQIFNIIKLNMINLGFNVSDHDKIFWCKNIENYLENPNFYFYLIYLDGEIVGFIEIVNENNCFIISEIQLNDKVKHTKIILEIIKYLLKCPEFADVNEMNFSILKHNTLSNKTFSHLGGKIVSENDKKYKYTIHRSCIDNYVSKLNN